MIRALASCRRGAQQVEYILLIGCVVLLAILAFRKFGFQVREKVDRQTETVMTDD
jgi:Flp pilus assembly pilin Flp